MNVEEAYRSVCDVPDCEEVAKGVNLISVVGFNVYDARVIVSVEGFETSADRRRDYPYQRGYGHTLIIDDDAKPRVYVDGRSF